MDTSETISEKATNPIIAEHEAAQLPPKKRPSKDGKASGSQAEEVIKIQNNILC